MKKITLKLIVLILLISCSSKKDYDCDSDLAISTIKSIYKDALLDSPRIKYSGIQESSIEEFVNDKLEFSMIRATSVNEKIMKCECEAKLKFNVEEEYIEKQRENNPLWNTATTRERLFLNAPIKSELKNGIDILYTVQETNIEEVVAETYEIEKLPAIFKTYNSFQKKRNQTLTNAILKDFEWMEGYHLTFQKQNGSEILIYAGDDKGLKKGSSYDVTYKIVEENTDLEGNKTDPYQYFELIDLKEN